MGFLDPLLNPVLQLGPLPVVIILSLVISLIVVLVYKFFTNQEEMKRIKEQQKEYQKRIRELKDSPQEMMKLQKEAMSKNMEYMKHSLKATIITILPIILIFGWMNAHLAYEPIYPGETYSITAFFREGVSGTAELLVEEGTEITSEVTQPINSEATWNLRSTEGIHFLTVKAGEQQQQKKVLITKNLEYEIPISGYEHSDIEQIRINYNKLLPLGPELSLLGWKPGWLGLYIILSIVFSLVLRKLLKVY